MSSNVRESVRWLDVWSPPCRHLNKPLGCTLKSATHQICLFLPHPEVRWVISQSRDPLSSPYSLPLRPTHVSQITVIEQGWSWVWGDLSLHPLPPLSQIFLHMLWNDQQTSLFSSLCLTLAVTQKSVNSFQVRSKAQYTIQVSPKTCGTIRSPCGQRLCRTDEGRLLFTHVGSSHKQMGNVWTWFQQASL